MSADSSTIEIVALTVAAVAAWSGIQQWWIGREQLRLDLFEKRHAVYRAVREFGSVAMTRGDIPNEAFFPFWTGTADAAFLFGPEVVEFINLVNRKGAELHMHHVMLEPGVAREARADHAKQKSEVLAWFADAMREQIPAVFFDYLEFSTLQGPFAKFGRWSVGKVRVRRVVKEVERAE